MKNEKKYDFIESFKWVYARLRQNRLRQFWILFAAMAAAAILETIALGSIAFFASCITDPEAVLSSKYLGLLSTLLGNGLAYTPKDLIIGAGFLMFFLVLVKNSVRAFVTYWISRFGVILEAYFGDILLDGFLNLPYQWHLSQNSADLVNAITWRVYLGRNFFQPSLKIFNNALMVLIMLGALFVVQPLISFVVIAVIGGTAVFIYKVIRRKIDRIARDGRNYQLEINKEITMAIQGIKDVKIAQKENYFVKKFFKKAVPLARIFGAQELYSESPVLILETIGFGMICLSIFTMLILFDSSTAYVTGTMTILAVTAWKALPAVNRILSSITKVRNSLPYISSQIKYLTIIEKHKSQRPKAIIQSLQFSKKIQFINTGFSYQKEGPEVIRDLNFEIKKGETIGIIGKSGAGKSTIVNLIIGLLTPVTGSITIDDEPLTPELLPAWLKMTGYVPQSPYIYDGTLAENVAFGVDQKLLDRQRVIQCCSMASMDDFMDDLPDHIDSHIGERGVKLSGGQQQRVAIARALYNEPEVMIFDEATSSLDTQSEKAIQETIYSFKGKQTLIIIAHRLSTVEGCDTLIWMDKGEIRMQGNVAQVLKEYNLTT